MSSAVDLKYEQASAALVCAWLAFENELLFNHGFKIEEVDKLRKALSRKDCYNGVKDCVMEVVL